MNFPNEVSCSILIDPRDLGNVIGGKNSIDPRDLTVLPDGFHPLGHGFVADVMMEFASARRAAREDGIDGSGWAERLDDGLSGLVNALRDRSGWSPGHPLDANAFHAGEGPRDERLVCRDLDGFADAGELAEENARLYGAPSVADLAETVWGCTSLEPVKVRHFGVNGFRGLEFSFRDGAETRMRAWQFDACPKVAAALAAALTYRCEKGFYMEAGCAGENGGVWGLSFDRKERGAYAVARFHPERAAYDPPRIRIQMPDPARTGREREHRLQAPRHGTGQADRQLHPGDEALRRLRRRPGPRDRRRPGRRHGARDQAWGHQHQLPGARRACPGRGAGHGLRGERRSR